MPVIEVKHACKTFRPRRGMQKTLLGTFRDALLLRRPPRDTVHALKDVSFTVEPGESFGIIGANGSGKSTLLKLLAGVTAPTSGRVAVRGRVASLLELGAGFHPWLTGRENVYLNGRILGMSRQEIDAQFDAIVDFAGVGEFIDNPLDTYSSGMYVRLGFGVAVHANPDVFLVDEVLSVGDEEFQEKCRKRIGELKEQGKTIVFVSHDLGIVNALCDRVVLLTKGEMVMRDSPRDTIDYYLRQVGQARSIHTFGAGATEAILSGGRLTAFHEKREFSASSGFRGQILHMGVWHESASADWEIVERGPSHCTARGVVRKLPVHWWWRVEVEDGRITWHAAIECDQPVPIQAIELNVFLPADYTTWHYGDRSGPFPEIVPGDVNWTPMVVPDTFCNTVAAVAGRQSHLPPVLIRRTTDHAQNRMIWWNTDYVTGTRLLQVGGVVPESESPLPAGRHDLAILAFDCALGADEAVELVKAEVERRTIRAGDFAATFDQGTVRLAYAGKPVTALAHFYAALLIENLWNGSPDLQWTDIERTGDRLEVSGESRRFPYRMHWVLEPGDNGVAVRIDLEATVAFTCQEYHATLCLRSEYARWKSNHEEGVFPPFDPGQEDWRHLNRDYAPGTCIEATGNDLPAISLETGADAPVVRMTPINAGYQDNARVLQALRVPEHGRLRFEEGRHGYFAGVLRAERT